ncbi:MAG: hypothetical protein JWQ53_1766, partial [Klenkia sp.]|nr:hypothetical protein [Klenkia sp.]
MPVRTGSRRTLADVMTSTQTPVAPRTYRVRTYG